MTDPLTLNQHYANLVNDNPHILASLTDEALTELICTDPTSAIAQTALDAMNRRRYAINDANPIRNMLDAQRQERLDGLKALIEFYENCRDGVVTAGTATGDAQ